MLDFTDQVVIVTGSGSPKGMGRVIAKTFADTFFVLLSKCVYRFAVVE